MSQHNNLSSALHIASKCLVVIFYIATKSSTQITTAQEAFRCCVRCYIVDYLCPTNIRTTISSQHLYHTVIAPTLAFHLRLLSMSNTQTNVLSLVASDNTIVNKHISNYLSIRLSQHRYYPSLYYHFEMQPYDNHMTPHHSASCQDTSITLSHYQN